MQSHEAMTKITTRGAPECAEAAVRIFKAQASGTSFLTFLWGPVPPRSRSGVLPLFSLVSQYAFAFCHPRLKKLKMLTRHFLCAVCQACARRCPECWPVLTPLTLTTGGRVHSHFRLRHTVPCVSARRPVVLRATSVTSLSVQPGPEVQPFHPSRPRHTSLPRPSAVPPLAAAPRPQRLA